MEKRQRRRRALRALEMETFLPRYLSARYTFFKLRYGLRLRYKVLLALGFAGLTGLAAQLRLPLPFTPVPITMQVFVVLLSGVVLGRWYGGLSQGLYLGLGVGGVPWFQGFTSGFPLFTGGYILGFVAAAFIVGWFTDRFLWARSYSGQLSLMLVGVGVIYALGALQLGLVYTLITPRIDPVQLALLTGVLPFIPGDVAKAVLAASVATAIAPKESYNGEVDGGKLYTKRRELLLVGVIAAVLAVGGVLYFWLTALRTLLSPAYAEIAGPSLFFSTVIILVVIALIQYIERKHQRQPLNDLKGFSSSRS